MIHEFINSHQNLIAFLVVVSLVPYFVHLIEELIKDSRRQGPDAEKKEEDI